MAVRLYIGGTEGNQDGELISNGDMSNPITFDGYDIETGDVSYAQFAKVYLRADAGEEWVGVCLKIADVSGSEDLHDILIVGRKQFEASGVGQLDKQICTDYNSILLEADKIPKEYVSQYDYARTISDQKGVYTLLFPYVTDINDEKNAIYLSPLLYLGLKDPNTSIKIIMTAGAKND